MSEKLKVIVHENNEVTVQDGRGVPVLCRDCRFSGWLTKADYQQQRYPTTCLFFSGGADSLEGDRIILDHIDKDKYVGYQEKEQIAHHRARYPKCWKKNADGKCEDFVRAKPLPWWNPLRWLGLSYRTKKMRS